MLRSEFLLTEWRVYPSQGGQGRTAPHVRWCRYGDDVHTPDGRRTLDQDTDEHLTRRE